MAGSFMKSWKLIENYNCSKRLVTWMLSIAGNASKATAPTPTRCMWLKKQDKKTFNSSL